MIDIKTIENEQLAIDKELVALQKVNGSAQRTDDSVRAEQHCDSIRKALILLNESQLLYQYYANKLLGDKR